MSEITTSNATTNAAMSTINNNTPINNEVDEPQRVRAPRRTPGPANTTLLVPYIEELRDEIANNGDIVEAPWELSQSNAVLVAILTNGIPDALANASAPKSAAEREFVSCADRAGWSHRKIAAYLGRSEQASRLIRLQEHTPATRRGTGRRATQAILAPVDMTAAVDMVVDALRAPPSTPTSTPDMSGTLTLRNASEESTSDSELKASVRSCLDSARASEQSGVFLDHKVRLPPIHRLGAWRSTESYDLAKVAARDGASLLPPRCPFPVEPFAEASGPPNSWGEYMARYTALTR
jgi:hypothetical protein